MASGFPVEIDPLIMIEAVKEASEADREIHKGIEKIALLLSKATIPCKEIDELMF